MKFSLFKQGIRNKSICTEIGIATAIKMIRSGNFPDGRPYGGDVEKLRSTFDKSLQKVLKSGLAYFTWSGIFKERKMEGLLAHSGLICIDFDLNTEHVIITQGEKEKVLISEFDIEKVKYLLSLDPFTAVLFVSPSGTGLKLIARINPETHAESFLWLEKYYDVKYGLQIDQSGKDVSRACFVSYDPYVFVNEHAAVVQAGRIQEKPAAKPDNKKYKVDEDTGEVIEIQDVADSLKKDYDRAVQVVHRIVESKTDITGQYDDWMTIGMCLQLFGEPGRDLFHKVSQFHPEYTEQDCNYKFDNYLKTSRFKTPAAFFKIAKDYRIDTRFIRTLQAAAAFGADGANYEDYEYKVPEGCVVDNNLKQHTARYGFIEYKNQYYFAKQDFQSRQITYNDISNFIITPLFLIISKAEPKRIVEIRNKYNACKTLDIPTKAFVSPTEFYAFVESQGNFLMDANKVQFLKIKSKLYDQAVNAEEVKTLGWHKDGFYAFANGISHGKFIPTDDHGVVEYSKLVKSEDGTEKEIKKYYFIPALSSIYRDEDEDFEAQKKFVYRKHKISLREWAEAFLAAYKDNGKIGLLYYITALFRDIVYDRFKYFPHLFLFGPPGSGKSTMAWSFMSMFGEQQLPFNLNGGTKVAFHKKFATFRNSVIWFDEYANSIDLARVQAMKAAYDGTGHEKSEMTSANRTKTTPVNSGCLISGQELPIADNALFKRTILLQYSKSEFSQEEKDLHNCLIDIEKEGVSFITAAISTLRSLFEANFLEEFNTQLKAVKADLERESVEERLIQHASLLLTTYRILQPKLNLPMDYGNLKQVFTDQIRMQNNLIANAKETGTFWDLVEFMIEKGERDGIKEDRDFKIELKDKVKAQINNKDEKIITFLEEDGKTTTAKEVLYIRLTKIHPLYLTYHRSQYNKNGLDKGSLIHYLTNQKYFIGAIKSTRFKDSNSSCYAFDYSLLKQEGVNLQRFATVDDEQDRPVAENSPF